MFKYRQSSDWFASSGSSRFICANRSRGTSKSASGPVVAGTGTDCGQTGEKRSANLMFFHVDGVTGGI